MSDLQSPDIIVFPECGLVGYHAVRRDELVRDFATVIPSPEDNIKPCKMANYSEVSNLFYLNCKGSKLNECECYHNNQKIMQALSRMSCAAENHQVYIVVNLYEKVICTQNVSNTCTENGTLLYNTNVAFDRNGKIIAR